MAVGLLFVPMVTRIVVANDNTGGLMVNYEW